MQHLVFLQTIFGYLHFISLVPNFEVIFYLHCEPLCSIYGLSIVTDNFSHSSIVGKQHMYESSIMVYQ
jgi:hypothetical protein